MQGKILIITVLTNSSTVKGAEATSLEIVTDMKKCFRMKHMLNFNNL